MVRGGAAAATEFTAREKEICETIGPELKRRGLVLVGIDVIDGNLTEINVTSPTGIRAIRRLGGPDLAVAAWDAIETARASRPCIEAVARPTQSNQSSRNHSLSPIGTSDAMLETVSPRTPPRTNSPASKLFDRAGLRANIAALHADGRSVETARPEAMALFRASLEHGRALVRAALENNGGGLVCAGQLAHIEDELIHAIHDYVATYVHPATDAASAKTGVVAAVGGYGRATLAPGSDIDLLFLLPDDARRRMPVRRPVDPVSAVGSRPEGRTFDPHRRRVP